MRIMAKACTCLKTGREPVAFEEPPPGLPGDISKTMDEIRLWLDRRKIEAMLFKSDDPGFEIGFHIEDEAELFRQEFDGLALPIR